MNLSTIKRLLKYPHPAVFDKNPGPALVMRLTHPAGARWRISDSQFTAWAGAVETTYDLRVMSIASLQVLLEAAGFTVQRITARYENYSALALLEGEGDQGQSNGDHIHVFTSLLWALLSCYAQEVDAAHYQIKQALLQMVIKTAEGEWLDLWGEVYGIMRLQDEGDPAYRQRIPAEAFRIRVNALAIEKAILDITGKVVRILEPWTSIFTLDDSELDGDDKFQDSTHVGYFFIQPQSDISIDWSDVLPIIERNRPAGVIMLPPQVINGAWVVVEPKYSVGVSIRRRHVARAIIEDVARLDYMDIEDVSTPNYAIMNKRSIRQPGVGMRMGAARWQSLRWLSMPWTEQRYFYKFKHETRS